MTNPEKQFFHAGFSLPVKQRTIIPLFRRGGGTNSRESGFVLVLAVIVLLVLSLLGIWALRTSNFELGVSGGSQQVASQMDLAEGSAYNEAMNVGYTLKTFYQIPNPQAYNTVLMPAAGQFNVGAIRTRSRRSWKKISRAVD